MYCKWPDQKEVLQLCEGYFCELSFLFDPCLLYFWVQSQTHSMGLTAEIKGLILRSSCCFFSFLQKPQGSGFIVFNVLSSLKITQKANNRFSCCLFPMRIQMSASTQCMLLPKEMYKKKCAAPFAAFQSNMLFRGDINEMEERKWAWTWS